MNSSQQPPATTEPAQARGRLVGGLIGLVLIAGASATVVSLVEKITHDRIAANQSARAMRIVAEVLPRDAYNNFPDQDIRLVKDSELLGSPEALPAYRARFDQAPAAVALTVEAPDGYIAPIRLLVGIDSAGNVTAVRALHHLETPGLGDQIDIEKSDWIEQFSGRNMSTKNGSLALRRDGGDLDHISGATITSRAVSKAVSNALRYYGANRGQLFAPNPSAESATQEQ